MPADIPWSVAGVSPQVREAARAAARRAGLSIGEWLEHRIAAEPPPAAEKTSEPAPIAEQTAIAPPDVEPLAARIEQRLQALEARIEAAEAAQAADLHAVADTVAHAAASVRAQGGVVDRLVAQFVTLSQRLENEPTAAGTDSAALAAQIAVLGRETKAQAAAVSIGLAALDDKLNRLRIDCAEAFADLAERQLPAPGSLPALPEPPVSSEPPILSEPPVLSERLGESMPEQATEPGTEPMAPFAEYSPLDAVPDTESDDPPPQEAAAPRTAPLRAQAETDDEDEPERKRPLALLILIFAAVLVAAVGLLLSRQPEVSHWYRGWTGTPPTAAPPPVKTATAAPPPEKPQVQSTPPESASPKSTLPEQTSSVSAPPDPQTRLKNLAVGGNAQAALVLGLQALPADPASSVKWLQLAAKDDEPVAQYRLGDLYERGVGVAADPVHAVRLFQSAAGKGNVAAMARLAAAFAAGAGAKRDYAGAAHWFAKAAKYGQRDSQFNLAVLYEQGRGVPHDMSLAYTWYAIAAAGGDTESRARLSVLAGQMSTEDRRTAKAAADAFAPQNPDKAANTAPKAVEVLK